MVGGGMVSWWRNSLLARWPVTPSPPPPLSPPRVPQVTKRNIWLCEKQVRKCEPVIARTRANSIPVLVWQRDFIPRLRPTWLTWSYLFQSVTYQRETSWNELLFVVSLITVRIFIHRNQNYLDPEPRQDSCNYQRLSLWLVSVWQSTLCWSHANECRTTRRN